MSFGAVELDGTNDIARDGVDELARVGKPEADGDDKSVTVGDIDSDGDEELVALGTADDDGVDDRVSVGELVGKVLGSAAFGIDMLIERSGTYSTPVGLDDGNTS